MISHEKALVLSKGEKLGREKAQSDVVAMEVMSESGEFRHDHDRWRFNCLYKAVERRVKFSNILIATKF